MCSAINFYPGNSSRDNPAGSCKQDVLPWMLRSGGCWDAAIQTLTALRSGCAASWERGNGITESWNALGGKGP